MPGNMGNDMNFSKIQDKDLDAFQKNYPKAYTFLMSRIHRNEWFKYANELYKTGGLSEWRLNRFKELTQLHCYDLTDIPELEKINGKFPGLVDIYLIKNY